MKECFSLAVSRKLRACTWRETQPTFSRDIRMSGSLYNHNVTFPFIGAA